jgi:glycosyltransferase involved in cell wall biosynthesis
MRWKEPMGLVMIESLACGTPVIVSNQASAPELVSHGKTGFLCDGFEDFVTAVNQIGRIKRMDCRIEAQARFDVPEMINQIERVYARASMG